MTHTPEELAHLIGDCTYEEAKLMLTAPELLSRLILAEDALDIAAKTLQENDIIGHVTIDRARRTINATIKAAKL